MKFKIEISTGIGCNTPTDSFNPGGGLDLVSVVREELKMPDLPADKISVRYSTCQLRNGHECCITSDEKLCDKGSSAAEATGTIVESIPQFNTRSKTTVYVPPGYLGRYLRMDVDPCYNEYRIPTDMNSVLFILKWMLCIFWFKKITFVPEVQVVHVGYYFDRDAFLVDWIADGCPDYYNCDKDEIERKHAEYRENAAREVKEREEKRIEEIRLREELARDQNRKRLAEYAEDLALMTSRLKEIVSTHKIN